MKDCKTVFKRYCVGTFSLTEFGLEHKGDNLKIEIKDHRTGSKIIIDDRGYDSRTKYYGLIATPYNFTHKPRGWLIQLGW